MDTRSEIDMTGKPKRFRKRSLRLQLERCLRDAEAAATADISTQKLIQTRLTTLTRLLGRERKDKLADALAEVTVLRTENERLRRQAQQDSAEVARLRAVCRIETEGRSFSEIATGAMRGQNART